MTFELRVATESDAQQWDAIISQSPQGTLFHTWNWLKITEKYTKTKLYPVVGVRDGIPVAVIPLFLQKKGFVTMVYSPPPHAALFSLGPVFVKYDSLNQEKKEHLYTRFQESVDTFLKNTLKAGYISISLSPDLQDPRPYAWSGYSIEPQYDYVTDLSPGAEYLLQSLDKKQRQNLNRATKRGMTVEMGGRKEFETILDLMDYRYTEQAKVVTESRNYFLEVYDSYKDYLKIFVAKSEGEIISGCIDFHYRDTHFSWIGNPRPKTPISPSPNDLLIWEAVRYAHEHGCRYYVTMSAAGNQRLHAYYAAKFNPDLKVRYLVTKKSFLAGILEKGYTEVIKPLRGKFTQYLK
jgi:lipid II:glycine glycyltransferase (peptidoglycan interpeptide bridge formation enzyme)